MKLQDKVYCEACNDLVLDEILQEHKPVLCKNCI